MNTLSRPWIALLLLLASCGGGSGTTAPAAVAAAPAPGDGTPETTVRVAALQPTSLDRDQGGTLRLVGEGLVGRLDVLLRDASGQAVGPALRANASNDGTTATLDIPVTPGLGTTLRCDLEVTNGDGRAIDGVPSLTLTRTFRAVDADAGLALLRMAPTAYADGASAPAGAERPSARAVSNAVCLQTEDLPSDGDASGFLWQWGQFVDHDVDLTPEAEPAEAMDIAVPLGDEAFDPFASGTAVIPMNRSAWVAGAAPRQQVNAITPWIDASNVYGSDDVRALALRTLDGTGRLRTSAGNLLPFNTDGLPNAGGTDPGLFLAGDVRANEQLGLTALHVLFVREHNRQADALRQRAPDLSGDDVYREARRRVAALMQVITYEEFLPLLIGRNVLAPYAGYDPAVDARVANAFSTAAYRLGHSLLPTMLLRLDASGNEIPEGNLPLRDAFFRPSRLVDEGGIEPVLRGLQAEPSQALDCRLVEDVRSFLFGPPGAGGLDLAALNIQRGRDHGLPSYNALRVAVGLAPRTRLEDVSSDPDVRIRLGLAYVAVDDVDAWVGGLAEDPVPGALVGELLQRILADQFGRLRDGDPFWYERVFTGDERRELEDTRLADVIRRNTTIGGELPSDVFRVGGARPPRTPRAAAPLTQDQEQRLRTWRGSPPRPR